MTLPRLVRVLADTHSRYRVDSLSGDNCTQPEVAKALAQILPRKDSGFALLPGANSVENRPIPLLRYGSGPQTALFWSQMHGDESTATLALVDIFSFIAQGGLGKCGMADLAQRCSLYFIPILNPDGAERRTRQTAVRIDMNRDARRLATPEGRFLRKAQRFIRPTFGFNLHDQELSTVGDTADLTAIALLAPSADFERTVTPTRRRAIQVASVIVRSLEPLAKGRLASYNDAFEPRAFGDTMQSWGTSTVLVESGHWINDPGKETIRRLNFIGLLSAISAISSGSFRVERLDSYRNLEPNGKRAYDIIVRGAKVVHDGDYHANADIGFQLERTKGSRKVVARVKELGDLRDFGAVFTVPGRGLTVHTRDVPVERTLSLTKLGRILRTKKSFSSR